MDNIIGALLGIALLIAGIAMFPIGFALQTAVGNDFGGYLLGGCFFAGILLLSAALPVPIFLLERFEGVSDTRR